MAEVMTYSVKACLHGAVPIPNVLSARWNETPEFTKGRGDDKVFPVLNRLVGVDGVVQLDIEDAGVDIALNTKATIAFTEKTKTGTKVHAFLNMVYHGESGEARSRGGTANARTLIFGHESADGVADWHTVT